MPRSGEVSQREMSDGDGMNARGIHAMEISNYSEERYRIIEKVTLGGDISKAVGEMSVGMFCLLGEHYPAGDR